MASKINNLRSYQLSTTSEGAFLFSLPRLSQLAQRGGGCPFFRRNLTHETSSMCSNPFPSIYASGTTFVLLNDVANAMSAACLHRKTDEFAEL